MFEVDIFQHLRFGSLPTISRHAQLALALQRLEEDEVQNMEEKEQMIMRDGKLATIMQQQEVEEDHK